MTKPSAVAERLRDAKGLYAGIRGGQLPAVSYAKPSAEVHRGDLGSGATRRSRDNLANPVAKRDDAYVPTNSPAIGDLMDLFKFSKD